MDGPLSRITDRVPISFRLAKWLQRHRIRGGHRLGLWCRRHGWWDHCVRYHLPSGQPFDMPLHLRQFDQRYLLNHERRSIACLVPLVERLSGPIMLIDCGADIGIISARLVTTFPAIERALAFEPNPLSYQYLANNYSHFGIPAEAHNQAVGDFCGSGSLRHPDFDSDDQAAFVVPDAEGDIEVTTLDSLELSPSQSLIIKIDVEGTEQAVVRGAARTLAEAQGFVMVFEANNRQFKRSGIDPCEVVRQLTEMRPVSYHVVEAPAVELDLSRPFFDQFPERIHNICVHTV